MNSETIALIYTVIEKIQSHACEEQLIPALAALERDDYEHVLAIARGHLFWLSTQLGYTPAELLDGEAVRYVEGKARFLGNFQNGKRHGLWREWHKNGTLASEGHYEAGKRHGLWREWYPDGTLVSEGHYVNGKRQGLWCEWYSDGTLAAQGHYENDMRQGLWHWWE